MPDLVAEGPYRVLWVGDPAALPLTSWHLDDGLGFATSRNGPPTAADQWAGPRRGADELLAGPLRRARSNDLVDLGHRLAPLGVRFVVVPLQAAPVRSRARPVPGDLPAALRAQIDLRQVDTNASLLVFENAAWAPARSQLPPEAAEAARNGASAANLDLTTAKAVLAPRRPGSLRFRGDVEAGEVLLAEAPSRQWQLKVAGETADRHRAFGVTGFTVDAPGSGTLRFRTPLLHRLATLVQAGLWLLALGILAGGPLKRSRPTPIRRPQPMRPPVPEAGPRPGVVLLEPVGGDGPRSTFTGGRRSSDADLDLDPDADPDPDPEAVPAPVSRTNEPPAPGDEAAPTEAAPGSSGPAGDATAAATSDQAGEQQGPASAEAAHFLEVLRSRAIGVADERAPGAAGDDEAPTSESGAAAGEDEVPPHASGAMAPPGAVREDGGDDEWPGQGR
jgi:hypothetical protein